MRVWKLNDYDYVAAKSFEEAKKWYMEETGLTEEDALDDPYEIDINTSTMWTEVPEDQINLNEEIKIYGGAKLVKRSYAEVIKMNNKQEPYIIATTEW